MCVCVCVCAHTLLLQTECIHNITVLYIHARGHTYVLHILYVVSVRKEISFVV